MLLEMIKQPLNMSRNLLIHYVLLAFMLVAGGAFITTAWKSYLQGNTIKTLSFENIQKERELKEKEAVIKQLQYEQKLDEEALYQLEDVRKRLSHVAQDRRNKLRELEKQDATVSKYLNTPIPPELRRLLNPAPASTPASSVQVSP